MSKKILNVDVEHTIGDKVFFRTGNRFREKREKCPACKGVGKIVALDNQLYKCPCCTGEKYLAKGSLCGYNVEYGEIVGVRLQDFQIGMDSVPLLGSNPKPDNTYNHKNVVIYDIKYQKGNPLYPKDAYLNTRDVFDTLDEANSL